MPRRWTPRYRWLAIPFVLSLTTAAPAMADMAIGGAWPMPAAHTVKPTLAPAPSPSFWDQFPLVDPQPAPPQASTGEAVGGVVAVILLIAVGLFKLLFMSWPASLIIWGIIFWIAYTRRRPETP